MTRQYVHSLREHGCEYLSDPALWHSLDTYDDFVADTRNASKARRVSASLDQMPELASSTSRLSGSNVRVTSRRPQASLPSGAQPVRPEPDL